MGSRVSGGESVLPVVGEGVVAKIQLTYPSVAACLGREILAPGTGNRSDGPRWRVRRKRTASVMFPCGASDDVGSDSIQPRHLRRTDATSDPSSVAVCVMRERWFEGVRGKRWTFSCSCSSHCFCPRDGRNDGDDGEDDEK